MQICVLSPRGKGFSNVPPALQSHLFVSEPVGTVLPKFPTTDNSRGFVSRDGDSVTLLCPAQGFPVPLYRYGIDISVVLLVEPLGKVRPNIPNIPTVYGVRGLANVALLCPAQAYPAPSYR